jgi:hypothetical protein
MFETAEAKQFFAAWQALRSGDALPHYRAVFQHLPTDMLPRILIIEQMSPQAYVVRFMGTQTAETWNQDLTGQDAFAAVSPKVAAAGRRNLAQVLSKPCGIVTIGLFTMKNREALAMENVILPAGNDPGRPARVLGFGQDLKPPFPIDDDRPDMARRRWIDLGFGVPTAKPAG